LDGVDFLGPVASRSETTTIRFNFGAQPLSFFGTGRNYEPRASFDENVGDT